MSAALVAISDKAIKKVDMYFAAGSYAVLS